MEIEYHQLSFNNTFNITNQTDVTGEDDIIPYQCAKQVPTTTELLRGLPVQGHVLIAILIVCTIVNIGLYIEEIFFITREFKIAFRKKETLWILAYYPVFSVTGLISVLIPRAGVLVDIVNSVYFGTCLYHFGQLMLHYMGGQKRMWQMIGTERKIRTNTAPICCCCVCLPQATFNRCTYIRLTVQVMQIAIIRPILMFIAAVLWANGTYHAGSMRADNGYLYITSINVILSTIAVYGLMLFRVAFEPELEKNFLIGGKISSIQMTMVISVIPALVISGVLAGGHIRCTALLPAKTISDEIYHMSLVFLMLPFGMMGRHFYRRANDGFQYAEFAKDPNLIDCTGEEDKDCIKAELSSQESQDSILILTVPVCNGDGENHTPVKTDLNCNGHTSDDTKLESVAMITPNGDSNV